MFRRAFRPGDKVPEHGIYWVHHFQHRLSHASRVAIDIFPECVKCVGRVRFEKALVPPDGELNVLRHDPDFRSEGTKSQAAGKE